MMYRAPVQDMAFTLKSLAGLDELQASGAYPDLSDDLIDAVLEEAGLREDAISIRMTGCPNGCARPYLGEIGLVGRAAGIYNLYLGASHTGDRLNKLYKESLNHDQIVVS